MITFDCEWTTLSTHSYLSFINSIKLNFSIICAFNLKQIKYKYVYFTILNETQLLTLLNNEPKMKFCISTGFKEKVLLFKRCWIKKVKIAIILTSRLFMNHNKKNMVDRTPIWKMKKKCHCSMYCRFLQGIIYESILNLFFSLNYVNSFKYDELV